MAQKPGTQAEKTGIYWCSVCKLPVKFDEGQTLPICRNKCGRGQWEFVKAIEQK
jgi:predicted RNA-binding protein with PUA domain